MTEHSSQPVDVVIIGSGPVGAAVARGLRAAASDLTITMIEGGAPLGADAGRHLLDASDPALRAIFERRARRAQQAEYVRDSALENLLPIAQGGELTPGVIPAGLLGERVDAFPGASFAWNVGGMGVHWTAASPSITGAELIPFIEPEDWVRHLDDAQRALSVTAGLYPLSTARAAIGAALRRVFPSEDAGRAVQEFPLAGQRDAEGRFHRTGPADIFPSLTTATDPRFELRARTLCLSVLHDGGRVRGVLLRDLETGAEYEQPAGAVVVAADALRTPQLLWASGIRPAALGRYLNEHITLSGSAAIDPGTIGVASDDTISGRDNEPYVGAWWLPSRGSEQPFHGQMMETIDAAGVHRIGLSWYFATEIQGDNRVRFSDTERDHFGLPAMTIAFEYSAADLAMVAEARRSQARAGRALGAFDPEQSAVLPAGSSLHYTGTVRAGAADDGTSVCDPESRVWGYDNLFVAGNGVIPTALSCNSTLTAVALALRSVPLILERAGRRVAGFR